MATVARENESTLVLRTMRCLIVTDGVREYVVYEDREFYAVEPRGGGDRRVLGWIRKEQIEQNGKRFVAYRRRGKNKIGHRHMLKEAVWLLAEGR